MGVCGFECMDEQASGLIFPLLCIEVAIGFRIEITIQIDGDSHVDVDSECIGANLNLDGRHASLLTPVRIQQS